MRASWKELNQGHAILSPPRRNCAVPQIQFDFCILFDLKIFVCGNFSGFSFLVLQLAGKARNVKQASVYSLIIFSKAVLEIVMLCYRTAYHNF